MKALHKQNKNKGKSLKFRVKRQIQRNVEVQGKSYTTNRTVEVQLSFQ